MRESDTMMLGRRKFLSLGLSGAAAMALAACGGKSDASDENVDVKITVWAPQEDQSRDNGKWLQA